MNFVNINSTHLENIKPPKNYTKVLHHPGYCKMGSGKKSLRKIFYHVDFCNYEIEKIKEFKDYCNTHNIKIPEMFDTQKLLLMLYTAGFNPKQASINMLKYNEFYIDKNNFTTTPSFESIANLGAFYNLGKDKKYRPVIYFDCLVIYNNLKIIDKIAECFKIFLNIMKSNAFANYYVENWVLLIETGGLGVTEFPFKALKACIVDTSFYFSGCMHSVFILNPCFTFKVGYGIIKKFIDPNSEKFIHILNKDKFSKILEYIPKDQLLKKYGGNMDTPKVYWPPQNTNINYIPYNTEEEVKINYCKAPKNDTTVTKTLDISIYTESIPTINITYNNIPEILIK